MVAGSPCRYVTLNLQKKKKKQPSLISRKRCYSYFERLSSTCDMLSFIFTNTSVVMIFFIDRHRPVWKSWHFCWPWQMHCLQWRISFQASNGWCRLFPFFAFQVNTRTLCSFNLTFTQRSPLPLNHNEINVSQHRGHSKRLNTIETVSAEMPTTKKSRSEFNDASMFRLGIQASTQRQTQKHCFLLLWIGCLGMAHGIT